MTQPSPMPDGLLAEVRAELADRCGLRTEEVTDASLERAVRRAADDAGVASLPEFVRAIRRHVDPRGAMLQHLVRKVTVGETYFLRHDEDVAWLRTTVLPDLVERRTRDGSRSLRIWSAGCATGEEPYTLALLAREAIPDPDEWRVEILATDINDLALAAARVAEYGPWSFRGVDDSVRARWFEQLGSRWRPVEQLRRCVEFDYLNLRDPIYPSILTRTTSIDLLLCRNVFIYFQADTVATVLRRFADCVRADGWMLTGPSDLFHLSTLPAPLASLAGTPHRIRLANAIMDEPSAGPPPGRTRIVAPPVPRIPRSVPVEVPATPSSPIAPPVTLALAPAPVPERNPAASDPASAGIAALVALLREGRYEDAARDARIAVEQDPLSIEANRCLALAASAAGAADELETWKRLVYLAPSAPEAHLGLGMAYKRARRWSEASRHFQAVVRLLEGTPDSASLPGPDALPVGWVRAACRSMTAGVEP